MVNHATSDVLVPVGQICRKAVYEVPGDSLPADFGLRVPAGMPGNLSKTLEECLPEEDTVVRIIPVPEENAPETDLPFDVEKMFNLNIYDDGRPEGYGTHSAHMDIGRRHDAPYLRACFARTAARTCTLRPGMLLELLKRWEGKSVALPAHTGCDDTVYGSLKVYREEIAEELSAWCDHHGKDALQAVFDEVLDNAKEEEKISLQATFESVKKAVYGGL